MSALTGFYLHPASPLHDTGWGHPEHQGRLRALSSTVGKDLLTLHGHVEQRDAENATAEDLLRVHTGALLEMVRESCRIAESRQALVPIDSDTIVSPATWDAAVGSAGAALTGARAVARGELASAFVAARPPGHHATRAHAMGFCLFNNVAVAARGLQSDGLAERVLIVDWDVHHGNGTQDVFYEDPSVFYLSLHQAHHYPGTGGAHETGSGAGEGTTLNVPLNVGTSRERYRQAFEDALGLALAQFAPDFVLVSAGFDVLKGDPLGGQLLEPEDLHHLTRRIVEATSATSEGRAVVVLEGGYVPERIGTGAVAVIRALAGLEAPRAAGGDGLSES